MSRGICELLCPNPHDVCPPFCYSTPGFPYRTPPSPPPPPPPPPTSLYHSNQHNTRTIITVSLLVSSFILVSFCAILVKLASNQNNSRSSPSPAYNTPHQDHIKGDVRSLGLEESVINSITVCKYKSGGGLFKGTECSICLNEFRDDENPRLLPNCIHAFRLPCIDTWLNFNVNCPLYRMNVISYLMSSLWSDPSSSSSSSGPSSEPQYHIGLEITRSDHGVGGNQSELGAVEMANDDIHLVRISVAMDSAAASMISKEDSQLIELMQSEEENRFQASLDSDNKQSNG